jgi:hypothetical protein
MPFSHKKQSCVETFFDFIKREKPGLGLTPPLA